MKTVAYDPINFHSNNKLMVFLNALYASNENFDFFLEEYEKAYNFCVTSNHINFYPVSFLNDETIVAHVALVVDDRLPKHEAFFGFFEIIDDATVFDVVWKELLSIARKNDIKILKGPVNGSIWHQYRCIKESTGVLALKTEPMSPLYYYDFLAQIGPESETTYSSGMRESYEGILELLKTHKDDIEKNLNTGGFKITVTEETTLEILHAIAGLSASAFDEKSWGYTKLEDTEFSKLYDINKINDHIYKLFLLYHKDVLVGYCSTMREGLSLICKTICIIPQLQGVGLGNALALKIHEEAENDGMETILYVLVRDGNQVHNYPTEGIEVFRRYAVFDYKITV